MERQMGSIVEGPVTRWIGGPPFVQGTQEKIFCQQDPSMLEHLPQSPRRKVAPDRCRISPRGTSTSVNVYQTAQHKAEGVVLAVHARSTAQVLEEQLRKNLLEGYWRVALRRYYMLEHCDGERASQLRKDIEAFERKLLPREQERMRENARAWADFSRQLARWRNS